MKRNVLLAAAILLIFGAFSLMINRISVSDSSEVSDPEKPGGAKSAPTDLAPYTGETATASLPNLVSGNSEEGVGKKNYDTGIRNDQRVKRDESGNRVVTEGVAIGRQLHSQEASAEEDLDYLEQIFGLYRLSFQLNPVAGDNQMIMEALLGNNPEKLVVFPSDHPSLDATGQLLDRWGTPYFFHALSGTKMEIFSAGPDREFNTSDDIQRTDREDLPLTGAEQEIDPNVEP